MSALKRLGVVATVAGLGLVGMAAAPQPAHAWWRGGWCCGVGIGLWVPPIVVAPPVYAPPPAYAPPPVYSPPPAYYQPSGGVWVPGHWNGGYWVPPHWS